VGLRSASSPRVIGSKERALTTARQSVKTSLTAYISRTVLDKTARCLGRSTKRRRSDFTSHPSPLTTEGNKIGEARVDMLSRCVSTKTPIRFVALGQLMLPCRSTRNCCIVSDFVPVCQSLTLLTNSSALIAGYLCFAYDHTDGHEFALVFGFAHKLCALAKTSRFRERKGHVAIIGDESGALSSIRILHG
jgi:hypothetical protein